MRPHDTTSAKVEISFRALFEYATVGIVVIGKDGIIRLLNPNAERLFGYTVAELVGQPLEVLLPENLRNKHEGYRTNYFTKPKSRPMGLGMDLHAVKKDGSVFPVEISLSYYEAQGEKLAMAFVSDITNRKVVEENLKRTLKEVSDYKYALDQSAIVAITDQKGIITHANDNFCRISKYERDELIGRDHRIINSGYHSKEFIRDLWVTIANGKIWKGELRNRAKDGTIYWVDTTIVPFLNEENRPYQYVAIRADITSRKETEQELKRINDELEEKVEERTLELTASLEREKDMNELKSRFVSMASHEFRTPLSAILSSISLIDKYKEPENEDKRTKHIERIKSSVRNLTDILNDFLSLDKLEDGKVEVVTSSFNLQEFLQDCIEEVDGMLKKKEQQIVFSSKADMNVVQDKKILRNVMHNLLSNAIKYSPGGKIIYLSAEANGDLISISVRDEGIGIPGQEQKHLFEKFFRARNAGNIQGTGLGLNIVKRYMELLGGNISFVSPENDGTTFTISFSKSN